MNQTSTANPYLRTKVLTASPEQLRLMLYDGAIKFCRQGQHALGRRDLEGMYNALTRAQKIVLELSTSLDRKIDEGLCDQMSSLYDYIYRRLVDANMERDEAAIDECIGLLEYERETWVMLMKKVDELGRPATPEAQAAPETPHHPQQTPPQTPHNVLASIGPAAAPPTSRFSAQG